MSRIAVLAAIATAALIAAVSALAATKPPLYKGEVGPGFTIKEITKPTKPGQIRLAIADKSDIHNFHLVGPGINLKTGVEDVGTRTFTLTLKKGTYKFVCDPHAAVMKGSFTIK